MKKGQANAQQLAGLAAADQGRLIESTRQLLTVLALLPRSRTGGTACNDLFADLLTQFPLYANLGVIGADGMVTCSGIPTSDPSTWVTGPISSEQSRRKAFVVGEYQTGRITGKPALNCGFPVIDANGNVTEVVFAAIDLNSIARSSRRKRSCRRARSLTVLDRTGHVLGPGAGAAGADRSIACRDAGRRQDPGRRERSHRGVAGRDDLCNCLRVAGQLRPGQRLSQRRACPREISRRRRRSNSATT